MMIRKKKLEQKTVPVVGLALSGGSALGVAHVGVLKAFLEEGIPINLITGTSAGSLVAACHAFGMPINEMIEVTSSLDWKKLSKFSYSRLGFRSNAPMQTFITDLLGNVNIEDARIPLGIVTADIETHEKLVLKEGSLHEAIRASTAIPGFFRPVEVNGRLLVDGAVAENLPVPTARDMGATLVIGVILSSRPGGRRPKSLFGVMSSSYNVLSYHHNTKLGGTADVLIEPDLRAFSAANFDDAQLILEAGYQAGKDAIPFIRAKLGIDESQTVETGIFSNFLTRLKSWF